MQILIQESKKLRLLFSFCSVVLKVAWNERISYFKPKNRILDAFFVLLPLDQIEWFMY